MSKDSVSFRLFHNVQLLVRRSGLTLHSVTEDKISHAIEAFVNPICDEIDRLRAEVAEKDDVIALGEKLALNVVKKCEFLEKSLDELDEKLEKPSGDCGVLFVGDDKDRTNLVIKLGREGFFAVPRFEAGSFEVAVEILKKRSKDIDLVVWYVGGTVNFDNFELIRENAGDAKIAVLCSLISGVPNEAFDLWITPNVPYGEVKSRLNSLLR